MDKKNHKKHECDWDTVTWETVKGEPHYFVAGLGETLERRGKCSCGKTFREVYLHSCVVDEETETATSL